MGDRFKTSGERIRYFRDLAGLSQAELAAMIGISAPSLSEIEHGKSKDPSAKTLLRLAKVFGLEPEYLLHGTGPAMRTVQQLTDAEVRLLLMYRELPPEQRIELEAEANRLHAQVFKVKSPASGRPKSSHRPAFAGLFWCARFGIPIDICLGMPNNSATTSTEAE